MLPILFALALIVFQEAPIAITSPQSGETLRGQVNITGNINVTNFASAELAFAYASDPTSTWFNIQTFSAPTTDAALAVWDTTQLTDGNYSLRLRVTLQDGSFQEALVTNLEMRNDLQVETATPTPEPEPEFFPVPSFSAFATSAPFAAEAEPATVLPTYPTPTPLPANPAALTTVSVFSNLTRGTLIALVTFLLVGFILRLRRS